MAFLELYDSLFDLAVAALLVVLTTLPYCSADLVEPTDNVLGDLQLQLVYIFIIDVFNSTSNEILINTLTKHRACLEYKPHLLLRQKISSRIVLIQ